MNPYDVFAPFYDQVTGDPAETIKLLQKLIKKHHPKARSILELACGTGSVMQGLVSDYTVDGLDLSKEMLTIAQQKLPDSKFYLQDMTNYQIDKKFDVALCVFDSVNHLLKWQDWQRLFNITSNHLNKNGLFIFDINTQTKLDRLASDPLWKIDLNTNQVTMDIIKEEENIYAWHIEITKGIGDQLIHKEIIRETAFDIEIIEGELEKNFIIKDLIETKNSERIYFVCQKK